MATWQRWFVTKTVFLLLRGGLILWSTTFETVWRAILQGRLQALVGSKQ